MLVLNRKEDESITIDGGIVITICRIRGNSTQIGIEAPRHINIRRTELLFPERDTIDPVSGGSDPCGT